MVFLYFLDKIYEVGKIVYDKDMFLVIFFTKIILQIYK